MLELEAGRARFFNGTWHNWRREQAAREMALGKAIEKQQAEIARMERFIERFRYKASKARQAQSRVKKLDKIERITRDPKDGRALAFSFKPPERSGRVIFELDDGRLEVPGKVLLDDAELWLERGEHVSLVGPNGTGKTTLLEALTGGRELDGGKLRSGHNVKLGYLSQHTEELGAGGARTVLEACQKRTGLPPNQARAPARPLPVQRRGGREAARRPQRRRAPPAVARDPRVLGRQRPHPRRADEPPRPRVARGARGRAAAPSRARCCSSPTTGRSSTRSGRARSRSRTTTLNSYVGGWQEYARLREERKARGESPTSADPTARAPTAKAKAAKPAARSRRRRPARSTATARESSPRARRRTASASRRALERAVETAEATLAALEDELADPKAWATKYESGKSTARHTAAKRAVEDAYAALEAFEASAPA